MAFSFSNSSLKGLIPRAQVESESAQFGRDARADWRAVFVAFFVLNLISAGFSAFLYERINKGEFFLMEKRVSVATRTLDRFALEQTVAFFEEKRIRFDALKRRPLPTRNPFIPSIAPKK